MLYYYLIEIRICSRTESVFEDETTRPPVSLTDIDLGVLFSNMTQKHHLENVRTRFT